MADTRRTYDQKRPDRIPIPRRDAPRRCENCGELFPADEVYRDHDEFGRPLGRFCGGCI